MNMTNAQADAAAERGAGPSATDLERRVAMNEHASGATRAMSASSRGTASGPSAQREPSSATTSTKKPLAAAAQARGRSEMGGPADPRQRAEEEVRP
jgi:hypothetical protein